MTPFINLDRLPSSTRDNLAARIGVAGPAQAATIAGLLTLVDLTNPDSVAAFLGVPPQAEFPSAGQARTWGRNEWGAWAVAHGYESHGETTHSWLWRHPYFQALVISVAKTPGDFRTPMAMATQTRRAHRQMVDVGIGVLIAAIGGLVGARGDDGSTVVEIPVLLEESDQSAYWEQVREIIRAAAASLFRRGTPVQIALRDDNHSVGDVRQMLVRITRERNVSARAALSVACDMQADEADRVVKRLSVQDAAAAAPAGMFDSLTDLLHQLREEDKVQRDQQRAERDAEREARRATEAVPVDEQTHTREQVQQVFDSRRGAIIDQLGAVMKAAQSTLDRARFALDQLPQFRIPALDDSSKTSELQAQIAGLTKELEATRADRDTWKDMAQVEAKRASEAKEDAQMHAKDRLDLQAVVQLVSDTLSGCGSLNPMAFAQALETLRTEAQNALRATAHPPVARTPPATSAAPASQEAAA